MKGDTHVAMAEAVDGANVVLYGVCEKYKEVRCFTASLYLHSAHRYNSWLANTDHRTLLIRSRRIVD